MNILRYTTKSNPTIGTYITNLPLESVILNDYYFFSGRNILGKDQFYSNEQVGLILNLTDTEYAELIQKYLVDDSKQPDEAANPEQVQNQIAQLEERIGKSRTYEDSNKRLQDIESELAKIVESKRSINEIESKYAIALEEQKQFAHLQNYNLTKIHDDLAVLDTEIEHLENIEHVEVSYGVQEAIEKTEFDKGKFGLAIGWLVGIGCFTLVLYLLDTPQVMLFIAGTLGLIIFILLVITSRGVIKKVAKYEEPDDENIYQLRLEKITNLKEKRRQILSFLHFNSTDEFFHAKAQLSALTKSLQYLKGQLDDLSKVIKYDEIKKKEEELLQEKTVLKAATADSSLLLKSDDYLQLYRELDSLKLTLSTIKKNANVNRNDIPDKLTSIRNELVDKLPSFLGILKKNFESNYTSICQDLNTLAVATGIQMEEIDKELSRFANLSSLEKMIVELVLAKYIYTNSFSFVIEDSSLWNTLEHEKLNKVISYFDNTEIRFVLLDDVKVL